MRLLFPILAALAVFAVTPAAAQLHERGVSRAGAVQSTTAGGNAFMCRMACSIASGCTGWNWVRAGEGDPQSRCELLAGAIQSTPDSCCDSGLNGEPRANAVAIAAPRGNQYVNRSQTPTGPPVQLIGDPTGGIWEDSGLGGDEESSEDADDSEDDPEYAEQEDDARFETMAESDAPEVTTPSARITSSARPRTGGAPRYSVQREYEGVPAAPAATPPPAGVADPGRWIDG
jgi:hypothetical protein